MGFAASSSAPGAVPQRRLAAPLGTLAKVSLPPNPPPPYHTIDDVHGRFLDSAMLQFKKIHGKLPNLVVVAEICAAFGEAADDAGRPSSSFSDGSTIE